MTPDKLLALLSIDGQGIVHNIPNARLEKWKINSLGFRGEEPDAEKKNGQVRIMCLGGSETFGLFESEGKEWPSRLGTMLKDRFPSVEVMNISVVGLHAKMRTDYIEKYILPLKPDILVLFHHRFLIHTKDSLRGVERNFLGDRTDENEIKNDSKKQGFFNRLLLTLKKTSDKSLPKWLSDPIALWRLDQKIRRKEKKYLHDKKPLDEVPEPVVLSYGKNIESFVDYLRERNIVPVISTFPSLITSSNQNTYKNILKATRHFFCIELSEKGIFTAIGQLNDLIRRIAEEKKTFFIDINNLVPKTLEYYVDNFHFTDKGAEAVAKNLYEALDRSGLLK